MQINYKMVPIIKAENIGKKFDISPFDKDTIYTIRGKLINTLKKPFQKSKKNKSQDFWALKGIDFEIQRGDRIGIIGKNGAGKSTLLKIISRITEPSTGRMEINGRVAGLLEIGTGFHHELTGRENIYLNGAVLGMTRSEITSKFDEIVDFAGIEFFLNTPLRYYSSGMYTKLAFAVAAHLEPEILLIDEVLAVGDADFQKKCLTKIKEVNKEEGKTILFVSHNLTSIESLCQTGILLDKGQIQYQGKISEVLSQYQANNLEFGLVEKRDFYESSSFKVSYFAIKDSEFNLLTNKIKLGSDFIFNFVIENKINQFRNLEYDIEIRHMNGNEITSFGNLFNGLETKIQKKGAYEYSICWQNVNLIPGIYYLHFYIGDTIFDEYCYLMDFIQLEVLPADYYGTGLIPDLPIYGKIVSNYRVGKSNFNLTVTI